MFFYFSERVVYVPSAQPMYAPQSGYPMYAPQGGYPYVIREPMQRY